MDTVFSLERIPEASKNEEIEVILAGRGFTTASMCPGPEGRRGCFVQLVGPLVEAIDCRYVPDEQIWKKCGNSHYIGFWKDRPPTSKILERPKMLDGEIVEVGGQEWKVPVCSPSRTTLPHTFDLSDDGNEWNPVVSPKYESLMKMCEHAMQLGEGDDVHAKVQYCMSLIAKVLGLNYHLGKREMATLGMVTTESFAIFWQAIIGLTTVEREAETLKKQDATDGDG